MTTVDAIHRIIELSDAINAYWDRELPKAHRDYPLVDENETSPPNPPEQKELEDFVRSLPQDQLYKTLLLFGIGRRDIDVDGLTDHYARLKQALPHRDAAATRILASVGLGDYLVDGMDRLKRESIDIDAVTDASVSATP